MGRFFFVQPGCPGLQQNLKIKKDDEIYLGFKKSFGRYLTLGGVKDRERVYEQLKNRLPEKTAKWPG